MKSIRIFLSLSVIAVVIAGCTADTETVVTPPATDGTTTGNSSTQPSTDDPAEYKFHRNVAFTDVTKTMPAGSVDHIDLNMAAEPIVVVVVTVSATPKDGLRFTTTFTGDNDLRMEKEWGPATGAQDDEYVGLFVLPAAVNAGSTVVQ